MHVTAGFPPSNSEYFPHLWGISKTITPELPHMARKLFDWLKSIPSTSNLGGSVHKRVWNRDQTIYVGANYNNIFLAWTLLFIIRNPGQSCICFLTKGNSLYFLGFTNIKFNPEIMLNYRYLGKQIKNSIVLRNMKIMIMLKKNIVYYHDYKHTMVFTTRFPS